MNKLKHCVECRTAFNSISRNNVYCSDLCRSAAALKRKSINYRWTPEPRCCAQCSKTFTPIYQAQTVCCAECRAEYERTKRAAKIIVVEQCDGRTVTLRVSSNIQMHEPLARQLIQAQNGNCALCLTDLGQSKFVDADHNHKTGELRGLLCHRCNSRLSTLHEDADYALRVHAYLTDPPARALDKS